MLVSLWPVDDQGTVELMRHFYRALPTKGPQVALAEAQRKLLRDTKAASPRVWAPFVLVQGGLTEALGRNSDKAKQSTSVAHRANATGKSGTPPGA